MPQIKVRNTAIQKWEIHAFCIRSCTLEIFMAALWSGVGWLRLAPQEMITRSGPRILPMIIIIIIIMAILNVLLLPSYLCAVWKALLWDFWGEFSADRLAVLKSWGDATQGVSRHSRVGRSCHSVIRISKGRHLCYCWWWSWRWLWWHWRWC